MKCAWNQLCGFSGNHNVATGDVSFPNTPARKKTSDFHKDDCDRGNVSGMYLLLFWIILLFNPAVGRGWAERSGEKYLGAVLAAAAVSWGPVSANNVVHENKDRSGYNIHLLSYNNGDDYSLESTWR